MTIACVGRRTSRVIVWVPRKVRVPMSGRRCSAYSTGTTSFGSMPGVVANANGASARAGAAVADDERRHRAAARRRTFTASAAAHASTWSPAMPPAPR